MAEYCHNCGKESEQEDSFCANCGTKIKELVKAVKEEVEDVEEEAEEIVKKSGSKGFVIFIIFLVLVGYVVLDIWAVTQIRPILTFDSVLTGISNLEASTSYTSGKVKSTVRIENPTFVPVILGGVVYEAGYGSTKIAEGKTGTIIMGPYSKKDVPADLKVSYVAGGISILKGIKNLITGQKERKYIDAYANMWVTKFKIAELIE